VAREEKRSDVHALKHGKPTRTTAIAHEASSGQYAFAVRSKLQIGVAAQTSQQLGTLALITAVTGLPSYDAPVVCSTQAISTCTRKETKARDTGAAVTAPVCRCMNANAFWKLYTDAIYLGALLCSQPPRTV
jgi:hypothetical protein